MSKSTIVLIGIVVVLGLFGMTLMSSYNGLVAQQEQVNGKWSQIENMLQNSLDREVPSSLIGKYAMEKLKNVDDVAYVRFASVYRQFKDINSFMEELSRMIKNRK